MNGSEMDTQSKEQPAASDLELNAQEAEELQTLLTSLNAVGTEMLDSLDRIHMHLQSMVSVSRAAHGAEEHR